VRIVKIGVGSYLPKKYIKRPIFKNLMGCPWLSHDLAQYTPGKRCLYTSSLGRSKSSPSDLTSSLWKSQRGSITRP